MVSDEPQRRSRVRRLLRLAVWAVLGLQLAYLLAANGFLRSRWGRETLNRRPATLSTSWRSAWTWLPGVIHVRGLEIGGRARRAEWRTAIDSGRVVVLLPSLLGRHFRLLRGTARGAAVEIRVLPPPDSAAPPGRGRPWRVSLDGLEVEALRLFRLNQYELAGLGRAAGRARFEVRGPVELDLTSLSFADTVVRDGGEIAAEEMRLDGRLRAAPFVVGDATLEELLAGLTGAVELEAEASSLGFLAAYLEPLPWLRLGGSGHLTADLEVTHGWLAPGSRIALAGPEVAADLFGLHATGEGRLEGVVPEGEAYTELSLRLPRFAVTRRLDEALLLEGEGLEVVVTNDSTAIDRPAAGLRLAVDLPPTRVPDLAAFSRYLPRAAGIEIRGGEAELAASLTYDVSEDRGDGALRLHGRQVAATFHDVDLRADLHLDGRLSDARLGEGLIDLSGTRLEISQVRTRERGRLLDNGWWGRIRLSRGRLLKSFADPAAPPAAIETEVTAELRDTGPLVALVQQHVPRLAWMDRLLTVHNVEATSQVRLQGPRITLGDLRVTGGRKGRLELLGELDLADEDPSGVFFARWGRLSAAVSLAAGERDWKLTGSRRWYDRQAGAYRAARSAAAGTLEPRSRR